MQPQDRIRRRMKLHDLHIFMTVVEVGSMNKAAAILDSTQPAISRSIGDLERTVGVPLLDRSPRGVEPTGYGRALLDGGVALFDDLRQTMEAIEFLDDPGAGSVRIGCSPLLAATFVCAVIEQVCRRYPRIQFQLVSAPVESVHRDLHERKLDLLITRRVGPIADDRLSFENLFDDSLVIVAAARHSLSRRSKIVLADLASAAWVLPPPDTVLGSAVINAFRAGGLARPYASVITVSPEARMSLVRSGRFLTIFPASALRFSVKHTGVAVLPVELPIAPVPNGVVTLKNRMLSPLVRLVIEQARATARASIDRRRRTGHAG